MRNIYSSLMRSIGHTQWFADLGKDLVPLDRAVQKISGGKLSLIGKRTVTQLLLTATGRKTGRSRTTPLLYAPDDDAYVVVGSNWGQGTHPAWTLNLMANPQATVTVEGVDIPVRATLAEGAARARLWTLATAMWPPYDTYADRAIGRQIRVFRLQPIP